MWQNWKAVIPTTSDWYPILDAIDSEISSLEQIESRAAHAFSLSTPLDPVVIRSKCQESLSDLGYDQPSARGVVDWLLRNPHSQTTSPELVRLWAEYTEAIDDLIECHRTHLDMLLNATVDSGGSHPHAGPESGSTSLTQLPTLNSQILSLNKRRSDIQRQVSLLLRGFTHEAQPPSLERGWQEFNKAVSETERISALDRLHHLRKQKISIFTERLLEYDFAEGEPRLMWPAKVFVH